MIHKVFQIIFRCSSISWFEVVSKSVTFFLQLAHLRVFQIIHYFFKWCKPSTDLYKYSNFSSLKHTDTTWQQQRKPSSFAMIGRSWPVCWWLSQSIFSMNLCKVSPLDLLFKEESSLSIGPLTKRHVWNFPNLSIMCQKRFWELCEPLGGLSICFINWISLLQT